MNGRYSGHKNGMKWLARDCDFPTIKAYDHCHKCNFKKHEMNEAHKEDLASLYFYKILNAFEDTSFGSTDKYGIYGATPP